MSDDVGPDHSEGIPARKRDRQGDIENSLHSILVHARKHFCRVLYNVILTLHLRGFFKLMENDAREVTGGNISKSSMKEDSPFGNKVRDFLGPAHLD